MEVEVKVLGGLPVTFDVTCEGPDPSVGIFGNSYEWNVVAIGSRPIRAKEKTNWIQDRLTKHDEQAIIEAAERAYQDAADDAAIERGQREREYD
jgi:hypothetical protein